MSPRAVGVRARYHDVPPSVRAWVDDTLGSPVVEAHEQSGGMSPGCATRVVCADGSRAFVKAVGTSLNPHTPVLFRREAQALGLLGSHPLWADLLAVHDEPTDHGEWVALLLEDVEGIHPDLTDDTVMERLLDATDELVRVMNEQVVELPDPASDGDPNALYRPGPTDLRAVFAGLRHSLEQAGDVPPDLMPRWVMQHHEELMPGVAALAHLPADHVVHYDIRDDNLLVRPDGSLVFLDWGAFGRGPAWLDPLLARLERVDQPWFDHSLASSPALRAAGDDVVTSFLVALGSHLAYRTHTAVDVNLPALHEFRRRESARFLGAAARRLGLTGT